MMKEKQWQFSGTEFCLVICFFFSNYFPILWAAQMLLSPPHHCWPPPPLQNCCWRFHRQLHRKSGVCGKIRFHTCDHLSFLNISLHQPFQSTGKPYLFHFAANLDMELQGEIGRHGYKRSQQRNRIKTTQRTSQFSPCYMFLWYMFESKAMERSNFFFFFSWKSWIQEV